MCVREYGKKLKRCDGERMSAILRFVSLLFYGKFYERILCLLIGMLCGVTFDFCLRGINFSIVFDDGIIGSSLNIEQILDWIRLISKIFCHLRSTGYVVEVFTSRN